MSNIYVSIKMKTSNGMGSLALVEKRNSLINQKELISKYR